MQLDCLMEPMRWPSGLSRRWPLSRREILSQRLGCTPGTIAGRVALNPPALAERPDIHGVEAELIEERSDCRLRTGVVAGNRERAPVCRAGRLAVRRQLGGVDVVERLDHLRCR